MLNKEMTLEEIESELNKHSDFLKIDMLYRFTNDILPNEQKIFLYKKLMELYKNNNMPFEAAKVSKNIAMLSDSYKDKEKYHIAEAELYIMSGHLEKVHTAMKDAMTNASETEKENIIYTIKEFYKIQAGIYERDLKRRKASEIYEKILEMNLMPTEREKVKEKLLELYDKLGKTNEYFRLKKS